MWKNIQRFLQKEINQQRKTIFLWSPVVIGIGITAYFEAGVDVAWHMAGAAVFFILFAFSKSIKMYQKTGQGVWLFAVLSSISCALFLFGVCLAKGRTEFLQTPMLDKDIAPVTIQATIENLVLLDGGKAKRVMLRDVKIIEDQYKVDLQNGKPWRVRLKTYHFKGDHWRIGDEIEVRAKLRPPSGPVMPDGFDFRFKAYYEGLSAVGYTMGDAVLLRQSQENIRTIDHVRSYINTRIYNAMPPDIAGVAQALLTGERAGIAKQDAEFFRVSGLAHLLAISGLHIGLVAGCVFFFIRLFLALIPRMALRYPIKKYAAAVAIIVAFLYMVLAGATVPTMRAFIMTSLVLLAVILDRSAMNMRLVALAAIIVMITTPESVLGPSFVLSFAAVSALIVFYQGIGRQWFLSARSYRPAWRPVFYVLGIIATTVVATFATAPFSIMFFNRFAAFSVLSNILAMPLMAFIVMPFGLLASVCIPLGVDHFIFPVMAWGIDHILDISKAVSAYPNASLYFPSFAKADIILIGAGFIWFLLWQGKLRWIGMVVMLFAVLQPSFRSVSQIMISEKMGAILFVDQAQDDLFLIGKMNGYLKQNWLRSLGYSEDITIPHRPDKGLAFGSRYRCDDFICQIDVYGIRVHIIHNALGIQKACRTGDVVIARIPIHDKACHAPHIIDRFDVWRNGPMTLTFSKDGSFDIHTVK